MPQLPWGLAPWWLWITLIGGRTSGPSIVIDLPAHRLELLDSGRVIHVYPVAIGDTAYPTPIGGFVTRRVVWDPSWIPPAGEPWARDRHPEPPGPDNPMGPVKLPLGGGYFIHGTPRTLKDAGAPTHGCVRLGNRDVMELAHYLEIAAGPPGAAEFAAPAGAASVRLAIPVPVQIRYDLVEIRHRRIIAHPDPYGRRTATTDSVATAALIGAGLPVERARCVVTALLDSARVHSVSVPLRSLAQLTGWPQCSG